MTFWNERSTREKLLIVLMVLSLLVFGTYLGAYKPLVAYRATAERRAEAARSLHAEVAKGAARVAAIRAAVAERKPTTTGTLRTTITISARRANIVITRLEPEELGLNVWLDAVPLIDLYKWLETLSREQGIVVRKASIRRQEEGTGVRAQLLFVERGVS